MGRVNQRIPAIPTNFPVRFFEAATCRAGKIRAPGAQLHTGTVELAVKRRAGRNWSLMKGQ
jgi:hypothetical protein